MHLYVCVNTDNNYTAYRLPNSSLCVPAVTHKVPVRDGLRYLYGHLTNAGDETAQHLVRLLREDLTAGQVLKRDLLQFARGKNQGHLGHVKAIVMLGDDDMFALRLKTENWILVDNPTYQQAQAIKEAILELALAEL